MVVLLLLGLPAKAILNLFSSLWLVIANLYSKTINGFPMLLSYAMWMAAAREKSMLYLPSFTAMVQLPRWRKITVMGSPL